MPLSYGPPDGPLGRELQQVAEAALGVIVTLDKLNVIPPDFPKAALHDLCTALAALPEGTAENCRPQLELARNALPKLRREHFGIEGEGASTTPEDAEQPRFTRGMLLDQQVNGLLAAVTTALDEYRAQAGVVVEDAVQPDDVAVPTAAAKLGGVEAQTEQVVGRLRQGVGQLDARGVSATEPGDLLRRRLRDSENLALAARSELRQRSTVARWFDGVSTAFRRTPDLIEAAGRGLSAGANAAEPLGRWLVDFLTEWVGTTVRQTRDLGDALQEAARRLREAAPTRPAPSPSPPELDARDLAALTRVGLPVSDDPLQQGALVIEPAGSFAPESFARADGPWTRVAPWITDARFGSSKDFADLAPFVRLTALQNLNLAATKVTDLTPLARLTALQSLNLQFTSVADLAPLTRLTALQSLNLQYTPVADLAPLVRLTALQRLDLSYTRVADLAPLASLTSLQNLNLIGTQVADLAPLANLAALQSLDLMGTRVADLAPLASLTALQSLDLRDTHVADLAPLASLAALQSLDLVGARVADLAPLASLAALQSLNLANTRVADLAPLASLTALQSLNLANTQISGLAPLVRLTALQGLSLKNTRVTDLSPLARLTALQRLNLEGTRIVDLAPLIHLTALERLNLDGTQIGPEVYAAFLGARRARGLPQLRSE
ncbi:leucine-rich repeat domain-containing protein [Roseomonas sp. F4]